MADLSILAPVYNEAAHLRETIAAITEVLSQVGKPYEIVLVDDGSRDETWDIIMAAAQADEHVRGVRLSRNFGKEGALSAGLRACRGRAVICMDADLQHPPALIPDMVRLWENESFDVVDAVKAHRGREPFHRKMGAGVFSALFNRLSGFDLAGASDYKLLDRKVVDALLEMREVKIFHRGLTEWAGFRHARIPFVVPERAGGASGWPTLRLAQLATNAIVSFSSLPLYLVTLVGLAFLLMAVVLGAWTLYSWFIGRSLSGFSTVILIDLIAGSAILISLGIIGLFIGAIYEETKQRPRYIVRQECGGKKES